MAIGSGEQDGGRKLSLDMDGISTSGTGAGAPPPGYPTTVLVTTSEDRFDSDDEYDCYVCRKLSIDTDGISNAKAKDQDGGAVVVEEEVVDPLELVATASDRFDSDDECFASLSIRTAGISNALPGEGDAVREQERNLEFVATSSDRFASDDEDEDEETANHRLSIDMVGISNGAEDDASEFGMAAETPLELITTCSDRFDSDDEGELAA